MNLKLTDLFVAEMEREAKGTRRALENFPDGRGDWKPHQKSFSLGSLATLTSRMPSWIEMIINMNELDVVPAEGAPRPQMLNTAAELVAAHDEALAKGVEALRKTTDEHLTTNWKLLAKGNVVMESPRHIVIRDSINHLAHHRGQLTVYLRLLDAKVPSIYGPSADDQRWS
ncbi:MAG TPA: DinB family protein [Candidatus Solibacter sp.]|nr:DinB family protein [Candidatus Solibacter sp.]